MIKMLINTKCRQFLSTALQNARKPLTGNRRLTDLACTLNILTVQLCIRDFICRSANCDINFKCTNADKV